jgi:hypothetical protein
MEIKPNPHPDTKSWAFDRSVEITLNQLAAAREIAIKLASGHEPNPSLVAGLVQAMATNYLAEMTGHAQPTRPEKKLHPLSASKLAVDPKLAETWPALNQTVSFRIGEKP